MALPSHRRNPHYVRVATLDVQHSNRRSAVIVGPLQLPPATQLSARLAALAAVGPTARVGLQPSTSTTRWRYSPDTVGEILTDTTLPANPDPAALLPALRQGPAAGIRVLTSSDYLAVDFSHGLGEIPLLHRVIDVLVGNLDPADPAVWEPYRHPVPPLLTAGFRGVGLAPRRLAPLWRQHRRNVQTPHPSESVDTVTIPDTPATHVVCIPAAEVAELRADRDSKLPGVSLFAIYTHALHEAFGEAGFDVDPVVTLPFDARRYLPRGRDTLASFSAGLDFTIDRAAGPARLNEQMAAADAMARPVANLIVGSVKARVALRSGSRPGQHVQSPPRLRLLHSSIGRVPRRGEWPFTDRDQARVLVASDPAGPCGVTVTSATVLGTHWLTAGFYDSVFAPDRVGAALATVGRRAHALIGSASRT